MIIYKCDRCLADSRTEEYAIRNIKIVDDDEKRTIKEYDLCKKCRPLFVDFIEAFIGKGKDSK